MDEITMLVQSGTQVVLAASIIVLIFRIRRLEREFYSHDTPNPRVTRANQD